MFFRSLKMSFWVWYDYMGGWFLINLVFVIPLLSFIFIMMRFIDILPEYVYPICLSIFLLYLFISQTFVASCASYIIDKKGSLIESLVPSLKNVCSSRLIAGLEFILLLNLTWHLDLFYGRILIIQNVFVKAFIEVIKIWLLIVLFGCYIWIVPSLAWKKLPSFKYLQWGLLLVSGNIGFTFIVGFCYTILVILNGAPVYFLSWGLVFPAIFLTSAYEIMARKYEALKGGLRLSDTQIYRDLEDEFLNRRFVHILKPWEM